MMNSSLKQELYQLINNCNDESLLQQVKALLLQTNSVKEWWDELIEEDNYSITESEKQVEHGDFIIHANLMQQFEVWKLAHIPPTL